MTEFQAWPKIPRLNRECIVTEKIDGTNAAVVVELLGWGNGWDPGSVAWSDEQTPVALVQGPGSGTASPSPWYGVWAQSRKRLLQTNEDGGKGSDNFGFAAWAKENALELAAVLGEGRHFGEWWGAGIQRGYGLPDGEKRFSLFNSGRWHDQHANGCGESICPDCCSVVPVLALGQFCDAPWEDALIKLRQEGSSAAPGFEDPEGIVVYHTAARSSFKVTLENDEAAKGTFKGMHGGEAPA